MDGWTNSDANGFILVENKGIYFRGSSKTEVNRKSNALFGTGNTENQYIDYGEQRSIYQD